MGKIDYNELMMKLDNCLGLEQASMESIQKPAGKPKASAYESYDEVENELAESLGVSATESQDEEDLIFEEEGSADEEPSGEPQEEPTKEEVFKSAVQDFYSSLCEEMDEEEARVAVGNLVGEIISPADGENSESEEVVAEETVEPATEGSLTDKLLALGEKTSVEGQENPTTDNKEVPAEEGKESVGDTTDTYDGSDAAFEALSAKMLSRYSALAHRTKKTGSATESQSKSAVEIDDYALSKVSLEFAYSGTNLRKLVTEALSKGVI